MQTAPRGVARIKHHCQHCLMAAELLNKAACRRYGLTRADVDRLFDRAPLFSPPDSGSVYVRRDVLEAWVADHTVTRPGTRP